MRAAEGVARSPLGTGRRSLCSHVNGAEEASSALYGAERGGASGLGARIRPQSQQKPRADGRGWGLGARGEPEHGARDAAPGSLAAWRLAEVVFPRSRGAQSELSAASQRCCSLPTSLPGWLVRQRPGAPRPYPRPAAMGSPAARGRVPALGFGSRARSGAPSPSHEGPLVPSSCPERTGRCRVLTSRAQSARRVFGRAGAARGPRGLGLCPSGARHPAASQSPSGCQPRRHPRSAAARSVRGGD